MAILAQYEVPAHPAGTPPRVVEAGTPLDPARSDAIRPVYPLETAIGIGVAGVAGGVGAAVRAGVGAALRQGVPENVPASKQSQPILPTEPSRNAESRRAIAEPAVSVDGPSPGKTSKPPGPPLPANPDDLLKRGWVETTHPKAAANGHRDFINLKTGDKIGFDKGDPNEQDFRRVDHYHRPNPSSTSKRDAYLDINGNPVPDGGKRSHIIPGANP